MGKDPRERAECGFEGVVMSRPHDAGLSDKERAILARIASRAEAEDPHLAAALRGPGRRVDFRRLLRTPLPPAVAHPAWGVAVGLVGLALLLLSLSAGVAVGVLGLIATFAGTGRVVLLAGRHLAAQHQQPPADDESSRPS